MRLKAIRIGILQGILLCLWVSAKAQEPQFLFKPGYFISKDGQRTVCKIKQVGDSSPKTVPYVLEDKVVQEFNAESVREFGIDGGVVFYSFTVQIDRSSDNLQKLSTDRNPEFVRETLFLLRHVGGKATLYEYNGDIRRFFFSIDSGSLKQLVYKRYIPNASSGFQSASAVANEQYKQQLFNDMKCAAIEQRDIEALKYERKALVSFFERYNDCRAGIMTAVKKEESKARLLLRPGIAYNSLTDYQYSSVTFESAVAYRLGLEVEVAANKTKDVVIPLEFAVESFSSNGSQPGYSVNYVYMSISGGVRKYFALGEKSRLFANAHFVFALSSIAGGLSNPAGGALDFGSGGNFRLGGGYQVGRFSFEAGYSLKRSMELTPGTANISYGGASLILGYYLF